MTNRVTKHVASGGGSSNVIVDLSDQLDGVTTDFVIADNYTAIALMGTQFPGIYRPVDDFTSVAGAVHLTGAVSAPASGQTLLALCSVA